MIQHLFDVTIHRTTLDNANIVTVHVTKNGATLVINGMEVSLAQGEHASVVLKNASASTLRHTATKWNAEPEVTSRPKRMVPRRPAGQRGRYLDPDAPYDTPSLDTSFHDHEMDV